MALSTRVLRPMSNTIQNPLVSAFEEADSHILQFETYFYQNWPLVKSNLVAQALHIKTCGAFLNGASKTAPSAFVADIIEELKSLVTNSYYFTTQFWRAFYYWRSKGTFNPRWPQFGAEEAQLVMNLLSSEQLELVTLKAEGVWSEVELREHRITKVFRQIQPRIASLCYSRLRYLMQYDPAMYSAEDLKQVVNYEVLKRLMSTDFFDDDQVELAGWAVKCAENIIHNLREYAQAGKRAKLIIIQEGDKSKGVDAQFMYRECALHAPVKENEAGSQFTLAESIRLLGDGPWDQVIGMKNEVCFHQLMNKADPKIREFLNIVWGGEHNSDFWLWFQENEPTLAARAEYIQENPEAIGPWVARWLKLPIWQLVGFLKENMPDLLNGQKYGYTKTNMGKSTSQSRHFGEKAAG